MRAEECLQASDPQGALEALQEQVRAKPADPDLRVFLFQLLAVTGQWQRAQTQLELVGEMQDKALAMVRVYQEVMNSEKHRQAVFAGESRPLVLGEPAQWMANLIEANAAFGSGDFERFAKLNAQALEEAPARSGRLNDTPFEWLADADQRLGPVFEMIFNGHYYWVPQENVVKIEIDEPEDLRDLIWAPAQVTWSNGGQNVVMIPSRYPRLAGASGADLLARHTDWVGLDGDCFEGMGQRMWVTEEADIPALQVRSIEFDA